MSVEQPFGLPRAALRYFVIDWPLGKRQPSWWRFLIAVVVAVVGSVASCAVLAKLGPIVFPSTAGYPHFQFADYTKLTVIGVVIACATWPLFALVSSRAARPLFLTATVIVTIASFAPDAWIMLKGQSAPAVVVLALMHIAVALVTYPALVAIAPQKSARPDQ
ncbi:hypothetical protein GCM10028798_31130 [Humibacter antri]